MALDYGLSEFDFWDMTLAEIIRAVESKKRVEKIRLQERATFDYILADLIGRSIGRLYSKNSTFPEMAQSYPTLFDTQAIQEKQEEKQAELSALRFKQFAQSFNKNLKGGGKKNG